jgi:hypothetical protein
MYTLARLWHSQETSSGYVVEGQRQNWLNSEIYVALEIKGECSKFKLILLIKTNARENRHKYLETHYKDKTEVITNRVP